jgi:hypothetical protein
MSNFSELRPQFQRLLDGLLDLGLDADQQTQLNSILRDHAEARSEYRRYLAFHADMTWEGLDLVGIERHRQEFGGGAHPASKSPAVVASASSPVLGFLGTVTTALGRPILWATLAASVLFACYVVVISWGMLGKEARDLRLEARGEGKEESSLRPAYISASDNALWRNQPQAGSPAASATNQPALARGEELALASGIVELKLKQGVTVRIEGPAEWTIDGNNRATLTRGKLLASVPHRAIGFTLVTPTATVVDLGTEFGVTVDDRGGVRTKVYKGAIKLRPSNAEAAQQPRSLRLSAGQSVRIDVQGNVTPVHDGVTTAEEFIRSPKPSSASAAPLVAFEPPSAYSQAVLNTPGLVGYWRLGEDGSKGARDEMGANPSRPSGRSGGRYARFHADDFRRPGALVDKGNCGVHFNGESYLEIADHPSLEGDWEGVTLAAWIKPDLWQAHSPDSTALIVGKWATDAQGSAYGLFYQYSGKLALAIGNGERNDDRLAGVGNVPIGFEAYRFVVGAWDKATGDCRLYVDGQVDLAQYRQPPPIKLNPKPYVPLLIGAQRADNSRYFTGSIDEVSVFNRALTADEIAQLYRHATASNERKETR